MNKPEKIVAVAVVAVIALAAYWPWYKAGRQSEQYARQGITLSQWDCFIGVKPAEQVVQIREHK